MPRIWPSQRLHALDIAQPGDYASFVPDAQASFRALRPPVLVSERLRYSSKQEVAA
jgi:hypothetical protein